MSMIELTLLAQELRRSDEDAAFVLYMYDHPELRSRFIKDALYMRISHSPAAQLLTMAELQNVYDRALSQLMANFWEHTYPAHDCHFHKSFEEFCNCPFTCLTEIADCVEAIGRGRDRGKDKDKGTQKGASR